MWHRVPRVLTVGQVDRFLDAPRRSDKHYLRDKLYWNLCMPPDAECPKISNLILANVHLEEGYCLAEGKGRKQRMVPLGERGDRGDPYLPQGVSPQAFGKQRASAVHGSFSPERDNDYAGRLSGNLSNAPHSAQTWIPILPPTRCGTPLPPTYWRGELICV